MVIAFSKGPHDSLLTMSGGKMVKMCSFQVGTRNIITSSLSPGVPCFFSLVNYQNKSTDS